MGYSSKNLPGMKDRVRGFFHNLTFGHKTQPGKSAHKPATEHSQNVTRQERVLNRPLLMKSLKKENKELLKRIVSLQNSLKKYYQLFKKSREGYVLCNMNGRIMETNAVFLDMLGYSSEEMREKTIKEITPSKWHIVEDKIIETQVSQKGYSELYAKEFVKKDGSLVFAEVRTYLDEGLEGHPGGMWAIVRDISKRKKVQEDLVLEKSFSDTIINSLPGAVYVFDVRGRFLRWNENLRRISGYTDEEIARMNPIDFFKGKTKKIIADKIHEVLTYGQAFVEAQLTTKDGERIPFYFSGIKMEISGATYIIGTGVDISERKQVEETLNKLSLAVEQSPSAVIITDIKGNIEYVNSRFSMLTGYSPEEVLGTKPSILKSGYTPQERYKELWETILAGKKWHGEFCDKKKGGELFWIETSISPIRSADGRIAYFVALMEDITVRKQYEKRLEYQTHFDSLTDLPNRMLSIDRLSQAISRARRHRYNVVVLFIDLDQFRVVNDTMGHDVGDEVILEASRRLKSCVRASDTVSRLGGDKFFIILPDVSDIIHTEILAQKILSEFEKPIRVRKHEIFISASMGLTIYPADGDQPHTLIRNAESAMYKAKSEGRNTFRFFTQEMNEQAIKRLEMETYLRRALDNKEFFLQYQPMIELKTGRVVGAEALIRWQSPKFGLVYPNNFIPLAEEIGIIENIGGWVLSEACKQTRLWQDELVEPLFISVNVSSKQFGEDRLQEKVSRALRDSGLPAESLSLEITEHMLLAEVGKTTAVLDTLKKMGVKLSLDDFGIGYSALSYLKKFPFNTLKIDRSFMADVFKNKENGTLVTVIIVMALTLGMEVIVEGIETEEQWKFVSSRGCSLAQGYYFSSPLSVADFGRFVINKLEKKA